MAEINIDKMAQNVAEKALDEILYQGKSIREWMQIIASEDCIRRQAVLETLDDMDNALDEDRTVENYKELLKECYEVLPSVNPQEPNCKDCDYKEWLKDEIEPKTGHWIMSEDGLYRPICDNCGAHPWKGYIPTVEEATEVFKYCPNCGCRMVEPQERQTEWIPVSEKLPKIADVYRVTRYYPNNVMNPQYLVDACFFDGSNTWYNDNRINHERAYVNNVIAWQENPEPYKIESEIQE